MFSRLPGRMPGWIDNIIAKFSAGDALPWTDAVMIADCEHEAAQDGEGLTNQTDRNESIMRLAWALVHSRQSVHVQRGIAMLEASSGGEGGPLQKREILYLLAVGHFRAGDYTRSRRLVDQALQIAPDFRQAVALRKMVEDKIAHDGVLGVGIAAAAVGVLAVGVPVVMIASGFAALALRKKN